MMSDICDCISQVRRLKRADQVDGLSTDSPEKHRVRRRVSSRAELKQSQGIKRMRKYKANAPCILLSCTILTVDLDLLMLGKLTQR